MVGAELCLAGGVVLLIVTKYEKISPSEHDDIVRVCNGAYSKLDIINYQENMLWILEYQITAPS